MGKAARYVELCDKIEELEKQMEGLEVSMEHTRNEKNELASELKESVGANIPRRVIDVGGRAVVVQREKRPKRKHKVGTEPHPDEWAASVSITQVEEDINA